jgi:hypothetical protein
MFSNGELTAGGKLKIITMDLGKEVSAIYIPELETIIYSGCKQVTETVKGISPLQQ